MHYLRQAGIGVLAGLLGGVVWGVLARIAMRIMALAAGQYPEFSIAGSLGIVAVGAIVGALLGLLYTPARRFLPRAPFRRVLAGGIFALLIWGLPFYLGPFLEEGDPSLAWLALIMFEGILVILGVCMELSFASLDRRLPAVRQPRSLISSLAALASPIIPVLIMVVLVMMEE